MRAFVVIGCLLASGCYDVAGLSKSYNDAGTGGAGGTGGGGSGGSGVVLPIVDNGHWHAVASGSRESLRGVFGDASGNVFAVGASSTILRLAAAGATFEAAPPAVALRAVWVGDAALAVGDSETVLTRGASGWSGASLADSTLYAVTGLPGGDALAVGSGGTIMRDSGGAWSQLVTSVWGTVALRGVAARAAGDVLVVGDGGTILHGSGEPLVWSADTSNVGKDLFAVAATPSDSWAVGAGGTILHTGAGDAWVSERDDIPADLLGVSAGGGGSAWAVGAGGIILVRKDGAWSVERSSGADLRAVWMTATGEGWAVGDGGTILHRTP